MTTFRQFNPLIIKDYVTSVFLFEPHGHTYYEFIYIFKGKGIHVLNNNKIEYSAGDLFLISPGDHHYFEIKRSTRFIVIKFTDEYFNNLGSIVTAADVAPLDIMRMQALKETKLKFNLLLASSLKTTIQNISSYKDLSNVGSLSHVYFQMLSVFGLIKEVVITSKTVSNTFSNTLMNDRRQLIAYIHQYIYEPQKCQIKNIARHFNISSTYFGDYFKRNYNISYRDYLNQYRTSLIQIRIESGRMSRKQIAEEFGFSDESHFSNYFKKQRKG